MSAYRCWEETAMINDVLEFKRSLVGSGYPDDFLAKYKTVKCLAHGENGETLIVESKEDTELYIAKVLPGGASDEGVILETLSHPALPRFIARFSGNGVHIMVREYVDGLPLDETVDSHALSDAETVAVGIQLCEVLTYLHTQTPPIIHRDVKPQNVILCPDGKIKLIDFGISRRYKENSAKDTVFSGTSDFAPPEQYGFTQTDARADIYSLGMLIKFLLTGGSESVGIENRRLARVVKRCTAFTPRWRYQSAKSVKRALLAETPKQMRKNAALFAAAMLLLGALLGRFAVPAVESRIAEAQAEASGIAQEYARAEEYGFIPAELAAADPDKTVVTWEQYCAMLGNMISAYDETLLPEWERMTASAPNTQMKRDGGMMSLLFAAELMDIDSFNTGASPAFADYAPEVWDNVTMDYPVFDFRQPKEITRDCYDDNYVGPSYDFCVRRVSNVTGKPLLEFDRRGDLRLSEPFTLREAAQAVLRLYESAN